MTNSFSGVEAPTLKAARRVIPAWTTIDARTTAPDLSVVIPAFNEEGCIAETIAEVDRTLQRCIWEFEILVVDDGSSDRTPEILAALRRRHPALRVWRLTPNCGQSAALGVGFQASRGRVVVMMDADGQNDPADIPRLLDGLRDRDACCGYRRERQDAWPRRVAGRLANAVRRSLLHDGIIDTGCSLRAIRADLVRDLPMSFKGMHRFIPALLLMRQARVQQIPVNHRPRTAGNSKYTNLGRLRETLRDVRAVRWMQTRHRSFSAVEAP